MKQQAAQVYFPLPVYIQMKQIALKKGKPLAGWIREVMMEQVETTIKTASDLADLTAFKWPDGDPSLSEHIDDSLYGDS